MFCNRPIQRKSNYESRVQGIDTPSSKNPPKSKVPKISWEVVMFACKFRSAFSEHHDVKRRSSEPARYASTVVGALIEGKES